MNRKRNVSYIKPEDPDFLKKIKKQVSYNDKNQKFEVSEEDFADDNECEQPQVVVLNEGDLTAEEAEMEMQKVEKTKGETKADLNQRVIFKAKTKTSSETKTSRWDGSSSKSKSIKKKADQLLSFAGDDNDEDSLE